MDADYAAIQDIAVETALQVVAASAAIIQDGAAVAAIQVFADNAAIPGIAVKTAIQDIEGGCPSTCFFIHIWTIK